MEFQTSDVNIRNGNKKYPIETSFFHTDFCVQAPPGSSSSMFPLLLLTVGLHVQNAICNSLLLLPQAGAKFEQNLMIRTTQNLDPFDKKPGYYVNHF